MQLFASLGSVTSEELYKNLYYTPRHVAHISDTDSCVFLVVLLLFIKLVSTMQDKKRNIGCLFLYHDIAPVGDLAC